MPEKTINGITIAVDDDGFMTDHSQWTKEVAEGLAAEEGIALAEDHAEKGAVPGMRRMNKVGGIPTKDLYRLFPDGPIKKASKIAGFPKPASCV